MESPGVLGLRSEKRGVLRLPSYRLYRLDGAGRISGAEWIEATDDDQARAQARSRPSSGGYELWERYRLVERSRPEDQ